MAQAHRSPVSRLVAHARWRGQQAARRIRQASVLDLHRDPARGLHIAGWQRSGSTWLARMATSSASTRMVYEPSNIRPGLFTGGAPHLHPLPLAGPEDDLGIDGADIIDALSGRVSTEWTNPQVTDRLPRRRVVKDVRTVGTVPWIADRLPDTPVILLLRHPMAVAHSIIELGWNADAATTSDAALAIRDPDAARAAREAALLDEVRRWAVPHGFSLRHPASVDVHVILYEELALDPEAELRRLAGFLDRYEEHWGDWAPDPAKIEAPSKTSFRRAESSPAAWIDSWSASYSPATLDAVGAVLAAEGIDRIYGTSSLPLLTGDAVLDAMAR